MKTYFHHLHKNYNTAMDKGIILLTFTSILLLFILTNFAWKNYQGEISNHVDLIAKSDANCLVNLSACEASFQINKNVNNETKTYLKKLQLSISPTPMPLLKPFQIKVKTELEKIKSVFLSFKGKEMGMGPNRIKLERQQDGYYMGQGTLPICTFDTMNWEAQVYVQTDKKLFLSLFNFVTYNKS
ncbi:MAG: hypothetical protein HQL46_08240 [Gammaproteobacteria bacterium]|nr:hypothetical protein [Gammaproteobacteria bacterium]